MWLLLQPRGVIGATFLYATLVFGVAGTLVGGWSATGALAIQWPAFTGFTDATARRTLFPFLFITIACGACSGFHSIVASGTTCKQVRNERDVRPIGYGAMLLEAMVAVFALASRDDARARHRGGEARRDLRPRASATSRPSSTCRCMFAVSFGLLAFSSFVFDTLDVCTRLGRYVLQEMTGLKGLAGGAIATLITLAAPSVYLWNMPPGSFLHLLDSSSARATSCSRRSRSSASACGSGGRAGRSGSRSCPRCSWSPAPAPRWCSTSAPSSAYRIRPETLMLTNMSIAAVLFLLGGLVVFEALRVWRMSRGGVPAPTQV